jgi:hypothetical protein
VQNSRVPKHFSTHGHDLSSPVIKFEFCYRSKCKFDAVSISLKFTFDLHKEVTLQRLNILPLDISNMIDLTQESEDITPVEVQAEIVADTGSNRGYQSPNPENLIVRDQILSPQLQLFEIQKRQLDLEKRGLDLEKRELDLEMSRLETLVRQSTGTASATSSPARPAVAAETRVKEER